MDDTQYVEPVCFPQAEVVLASPAELLIAKYAAKTGVSRNVLAAVIQVESGGDSLAVNPDDPSYGLGQVMPYWWRYAFVKQCGGEATPETLMDPELNICYSAHILKHFQSVYGYTAGIDAYNNGHGAARGYSDAVLDLVGG